MAHEAGHQRPVIFGMPQPEGIAHGRNQFFEFQIFFKELSYSASIIWVTSGYQH
jgi:hypothetical protein